MAQLIVRGLPDELVEALKQQAAKCNRSAEQEHREILRAALDGPRNRHLADVLAAIPDVGEDSAFRRDPSVRPTLPALPTNPDPTRSALCVRRRDGVSAC